MPKPNPSLVSPADVQVLFIDLQKQIVARSKTTAPKALATSAAVLAQLARVFALPVTVSVVPEGGAKPELLPELAAATTDAPQLLRTGASALLDAPTAAALATYERRTLVVAGFATEVAVLHAATAALDAGYRVLVVVDACGGLSERTERAALDQLTAYGAEITSTVTLATALEPDFTTALGQQMFGVIEQLRLG